MKIWRKRIACWIPKATNTLGICFNYCLSTAAIIARTRLSVTLYVHCQVCQAIRTLSNVSDTELCQSVL